MNLLEFKKYDRENCISEAKKMKMLANCEYVIQFRDVFWFDSIICIVMEYADGGNLQDLIDERI